MIPPDYSVEAQPASEDIANALQMLRGWRAESLRGDLAPAERILESALRKLGAVPPAEHQEDQ